MDDSLRRTLADAGLNAEDAPTKRPRAASWRSKVGTLVGRLIEALRAQPGINVRQPSAHAPPFRSVPASYHGRATLTLDPAAGDRQVSFCPITWSGDVSAENATTEVALSTVPAIPEGDPFPDGLIGHVKVSVRSFALSYPAGGGSFDPTVGVKWTLFQNGVPPFGYQSRMPGTTVGANIESALGVLQQHLGAWATIDTAPTAPLLLLPGDRLTVRVDRMPGFAAGLAVVAIVLVEGWAYPVRRTSDDIRTTLTD